MTCGGGMLPNMLPILATLDGIWVPGGPCPDLVLLGIPVLGGNIVPGIEGYVDCALACPRSEGTARGHEDVAMGMLEPLPQAGGKDCTARD